MWLDPPPPPRSTLSIPEGCNDVWIETTGVSWDSSIPKFTTTYGHSDASMVKSLKRSDGDFKVT